MTNKFPTLLTTTFVLTAIFACGRQVTSNTTSTEPISITIDSRSFHKEVFRSRHDGDSDWQSALAMNVTYAPIVSARKQIETHLYNEKLNFLKTWEPNGEAHITVITPVEYQLCMWSQKRSIQILHMKEIESIAKKQKIQSSPFTITGLGYGSKYFTDSFETGYTHFFIVESKDLRLLRHTIYEKFLQNGGDKNCWHPDQFFPHITIGYTHKDIHYPDIKKDLENSKDPRLAIEVL